MLQKERKKERKQWLKQGLKSKPWKSHGDTEECEKPVVESTLAVSLGDSLGLVTLVAAVPAAAAAPAAGEGAVAETLTWETGAVYKHVAKWLLQNTTMKDL